MNTLTFWDILLHALQLSVNEVINTTLSLTANIQVALSAGELILV